MNQQDSNADVHLGKCAQTSASEDHGHPMFFSITTNANILWSGWTIATQNGLILAAIFSLALAVLLEALKCYICMKQLKRTPQKSRWQQVIRSLLYMVQALAGYILMVMAMTFNAWIMVSIVLGSGLGYYLIRHVLHTAECRAKKFKLAQKRLMASPPLLQPQPQPRPEVCMCAKIKEATVAECRKERWPADDPLLKSLRATADGKETAV